MKVDCVAGEEDGSGVDVGVGECLDGERDHVPRLSRVSLACSI